MTPTAKLIDLCRKVEELERECIDIAKSGDTEGWIEAGKKYGPRAIQLAKHSCRLLPPLIEAAELALAWPRKFADFASHCNAMPDFDQPPPEPGADWDGVVKPAIEKALALVAKEMERK